MDLIAVVCLWNDDLKHQIMKITNQCDFPFFIRALSDKQQFWFACVWMSMFTGSYFQENPNQDLDVFFQKADKIISNMPDLFNDRVFMQAHGLLWKYGFKKFFNNIHYVVDIAKLLKKEDLNNNIND